ncbi:universal stress protein [Lentiprolixibacter aurantiacus]|uniref:Universal stress protein n=1 Tax=Lentiprolixibacter aurantiacus TaxID=2993939 RepID=A0AAE3SPD6_9FLAO|nr:universal stress protein [Lentiprolixibacter aurantiacus]MCX2720106.1 universal stress protein [Lentiprolixibacter aurantiacus]
MKNMLVLTDFSNNAYNALYYATRLFRDVECRIYLLNVFSENTPLISPNRAKGKNRNLLVQLEEESREGLEKDFHRINLDAPNEKHLRKTISRKGNLPDIVHEIVADREIDLIVMGNTGKTEAIPVFMGSNVINVVKAMPDCPVLAVPREKECDIPFEIAFATDYNRNYDAQVMNPLCFMASICKAAIRIIHINEEGRLSSNQKTNLNTLREYLRDLRHTVHWMPDFSSKTEVINTFLEELGIGMISMIYYRHGFLENLMRERVIKRMSFEVEVPFLIIPQAD